MAPFVSYCLLLDLFFGSSQTANWFLSYGNYKFLVWDMTRIYLEYTWHIQSSMKKCFMWDDLMLLNVFTVSLCPTCLLITWRHGNQFFRSKRAAWQVLEFPFSVICTGCRNGQESLTGPKLRHVFTRHMGARKPDFHVETRWFTCTRIPFCDVLRRLQNRSGVTNQPETWCKRFISEQSTIVDIIGCNWSIIFGVVMCRTWPPWPFVRHAPKS